MAAVIRVKRRIDEEPLNAFVLNCKRQKIDAADSLLANKNETSTILKFAGTVDNQDNIATHINKLTKDDAIEAATKLRKPNNITLRNREQHRQLAQDNRFKIVNCFRALDDGADRAIHNITVVDIEKQSEQQSATVSTASAVTDDFVYDLYLAQGDQTADIDSNLVDNLLSIRPFDDLTYGSRKDNGIIASSDSEDSEDSNDENNWKNEYPDTEDDSSIGEEDMCRAVHNLDLAFKTQLSSDDDESAYTNGFVYSIDSESFGFEDDIDYSDVNRYGEAYARYKARIKKESDIEFRDECCSDNYDSD